MHFEQLDEVTRRWMSVEFEAEQQSGSPYLGKNLSPVGISEFPSIMRAAIQSGDVSSLAVQLGNPTYWNAQEYYERDGIVRPRNINTRQAAERLAATEFNTWFVRGLARRGIEEGILECEVYRAAQPKWEPATCTAHEGSSYAVTDVYSGHRAKYWPEPGDQAALSVPFGPGCHHTIRLKLR